MDVERNSAVISLTPPDPKVSQILKKINRTIF